ncbi:HNH endonuclease [Sulfitobacter albidus]|uniref:HNH endonuclease n=1 Tax=Sulfitobacter albidus TaxID=2829501 RepID=A0A975JDM1_9RHOB|nr:HNH endonuclease [Sulfitobacter albidus]QUJ76539.1 HNH endonuclease [Sulfitobacter albidus]
MAHAVFIQNPRSIYADRPGEVYHFPKQYLAQVTATIGDWVVFYESKNAGAFGYVAVQQVADVVPDPAQDDHYFAILDPATLLEFERVVPRRNAQDTAFESVLRGPDGKPYRAGANTLAVRTLPPADFAAIVNHGLTPVEDVSGMARRPLEDAAQPGFAEAQAAFGGAPLDVDRRQVLSSRPLRDAAFARQVKRAYHNRCAMSGLSLTNGGGRPEVEAAHIRPVSDRGPDIVRNGLALSGTLHWMFDRGLLGVAEDHSILISHNKVPQDVVARLIAPAGRLFLPPDPRHHPHESYLKYHRENVFGQFAA